MNRPAKSAAYVARTRPVVPPIYQSATFYLDDVAYKDIQGNGGRPSTCVNLSFARAA